MCNVFSILAYLGTLLVVYISLATLKTWLSNLDAPADCNKLHTWGKWAESADLVSEIIIKRSCKVCGELQVEGRKAAKCSPTSD